MGNLIPETGGRIFWTGTNANIPSRGVLWEEDAAFADRYLQGDTVTYAGPANAGGSHTHTLTDHTHLGVAHSHTFSGSAITFSTTGADLNDPGTDAADETHGHPDVITTPTAVTTYSTDAMTFIGKETHPEHIRLIVLKVVAAAGDQYIPDDGVVLSNNANLPTGFTKVAALHGKFLRAVSSGEDSDLGGDGSATHQHITGIVDLHGHTANAHTHTGIASGDTGDAEQHTVLARGGTPTSTHSLNHHPSVSMDGATSGNLTDQIDASGFTSSEPAFIELLPLQNTSGGDVAPFGGSTIIPYIAAHGTIPAGWEFYAAGDGLQVKCTTTDGDVEDTGGDNNHVHTSSHGHGQTFQPHLHTATVSNSSKLVRGGFDDVIAAPSHTHTWTVTTSLLTIAEATPELETEDKRAAYRTVIWIQKKRKRATDGTHHKSGRLVLAA